MAYHPKNIRQYGTSKRAEMVTESIRAIKALRAGRWAIEDLAAELEVGRRTAYRLLAAIERAGIPVARAREGKTVYLRITRASVKRAFGLRAK